MTIEEFHKTLGTKNNGKRKKLGYFFVSMCFSVILFSLYNIFNWYLDNSKIRQINKEIEKSTSVYNNSIDGELVNPPKDLSDDYYYYTSIPFYQVDFSKLIEKNKDTVAYIHINNTKVSYPVVKTSDNKYYLNHSFDKLENEAGWIFLDYRSNSDFSSDNTIIYGHARLDGTMFGTLKDVLNKEWQKNKENHVIFVSTLEENMIYQIFSVYTIKNEGYYITTNFSSDSEKEEWLDAMKRRNTMNINTKVSSKDKILTLSTCKNNNGGKIVVQAKLIKKQKR